jgi:hypothetical protein
MRGHGRDLERDLDVDAGGNRSDLCSPVSRPLDPTLGEKGQPEIVNEHNQ